jgi:hypothetical protein
VATERPCRAEYCARHGLKVKTFTRWMKHLIGVEEARRHTEEAIASLAMRLRPGRELYRRAERVTLLPACDSKRADIMISCP